MRFTPRTAVAATALAILALTACTPSTGARVQSVSVQDAAPEPVENYIGECAPAGEALDTPPEPVENYDEQAELGDC